MSDPRPIGVFDSGVGGLTVLREIIRRTPLEPTVYLGDNDRAPYGARPDDEVLAFSTQSLDALVERDVKALVVACNTSTAVGLGGVPPALRPAGPRRRPTGRGGRRPRDPQPAGRVIATPATIRSHAYFNAIKDENPAVEVYEHATPALVPMVESGELGGELARPPSPSPSRRSSASGTATASRSSLVRRAPRSTPCFSGARITRCSARSSRSWSAKALRSSTRRRRPRLPWSSCSASTGSRRRRTRDGGPSHVQLHDRRPCAVRCGRWSTVRHRLRRRPAGRARGARTMKDQRPVELVA